MQGGEIPSTSVLPRHMALQSEPYFDETNIEEAKRLFSEGLEELNITIDLFPKIKLSHCTELSEKRIAHVIQQQWAKVLGIQVELTGNARNVNLANAIKGDFQVRGTIWYSWMNDPTYNMEYLKTKNRLNVSRWENTRYCELIELAENEKDLPKRSKYFNQAKTLLMEEMPLTPVFYHTYKYAKKNEIDGICISNLGQIDFRWVEIK